jgi:hypothetical protein
MDCFDRDRSLTAVRTPLKFPKIGPVQPGFTIC